MPDGASPPLVSEKYGGISSLGARRLQFTRWSESSEFNLPFAGCSLNSKT